jgi:dissimilatory sulfite reductase (desulfoviridin) alpha/beta subunit
VGAAKGWRVLDWYKQADKKKRLGRIIDDIGLATFKAELGLPGE